MGVCRAYVYSGGVLVTSGGEPVWVGTSRSVEDEVPWLADDELHEVWHYQTDVMRMRDGTQYRMACRDWPMRSFSARYLLNDSQAQQLRALLYNDTHSQWKLPRWDEQFEVTAQVLSGTNTAQGSFANSDWQVNDWVFIARNDDSEPCLVGEFQQVASVTDSLLTIQGVWDEGYDEYATIYPVALVYVADDDGFERSAIGLTTASLNFELAELLIPGGSGAVVNTYQGRPLLDRRVWLSGSRVERFRREVEDLDYGVYPVRRAGAARADIVMAARAVITQRAEKQWWKAFFDTVKGRRGSFYASTWRPDLELDSQPGAGAGALIVVNSPSFLTRWYNTGSSHQDVQLETNQGDLRRRIDSVIDNGDGTATLTLDTPLPGGSLTVDKVSFLELCTLGSDDIRWVHKGTNTIVEFTTRVVEQ